MSIKYEYLMIPFALFMVLGIYYSNFIFITISVISLIMAFALKISNNDKIKSETNNRATRIFSDLNIQNFHIGSDYCNCVGFDQENKNLIILSRPSPTNDFKVEKIPFKNLIEVKLVEDEQILTSTSRASQIGGMMVGGILGGVTGAVVGGLSGTQYQEKQVRKIKLELVLDDLSNPIRDIYFLHEELPINTIEKKYKDCFPIANEWYRRLTVILKRNELNTSNL